MEKSELRIDEKSIGKDMAVDEGGGGDKAVLSLCLSG
jgi:hypothetical protein